MSNAENFRRAVREGCPACLEEERESWRKPAGRNLAVRLATLAHGG